jgi:hypothetical protein
MVVVKRLTAILFSVLLVWMQVAPAPAAAPACAKATMANCADCCKGMACCTTKPVSDPQPAPAMPASANSQNQISLLAPGLVIWNLPSVPAGLIASVPVPLSKMSGAPLYTRNCSRLL